MSTSHQPDNDRGRRTRRAYGTDVSMGDTTRRHKTTTRRRNVTEPGHAPEDRLLDAGEESETPSERAQSLERRRIFDELYGTKSVEAKLEAERESGRQRRSTTVVDSNSGKNVAKGFPTPDNVQPDTRAPASSTNPRDRRRQSAAASTAAPPSYVNRPHQAPDFARRAAMYDHPLREWDILTDDDRHGFVNNGTSAAYPQMTTEGFQATVPQQSTKEWLKEGVGIMGEMAKKMLNYNPPYSGSSVGQSQKK